jgi:hypothetical protein
MNGLKKLACAALCGTILIGVVAFSRARNEGSGQATEPAKAAAAMQRLEKYYPNTD